MRKQMWILAVAVMTAGVMGLTGCSKDSGGVASQGQAAQTTAEAKNQGQGESQTASGENAAGEETLDQLAQIQQKGELVVAMEGTWSPWTYHDESDQLVGYDVEVASLIAEKLGVKAVFVEGEWDGLFAGLDAGRYDIVVNGVEITQERGENYSEKKQRKGIKYYTS